MNFYEILGVKPGATPEEIKAAYRQQVKRHHPDVGGDAQQIKLINEAYETLADPEKRSDYDRQFGKGRRPLWEQMNEEFENIFRGRRQIDEILLNFSLEQLQQGGEFPFEYQNREINLKLPPGMIPGEVLEYKLTSSRILYIHLDASLHEFFELEDLDLYVRVPVDLSLLVLGGEVVVPTLMQPLSVKIAPQTEPNTILRVPYRGLWSRRGRSQGHLYVVLDVVLPKPNFFQKSLLKQVRKLRHPIKDAWERKLARRYPKD